MIRETMTTTTTRCTSTSLIFRIVWTIVALAGMASQARAVERGARHLQEDQFCCLCGDCAFPSNYRHVIDANGKTCEEADSQMFNPAYFGPAQTDRRCASLQQQFRNCCCNPSANCDVPAQNPRPAPAPPKNNLPMGNQPACSLCPGYKFPAKPYTITTVQYIPGNPTCQDLHFMGQAGQIPAALCYPLQLYMRAPCGC